MRRVITHLAIGVVVGVLIFLMQSFGTMVSKAEFGLYNLRMEQLPTRPASDQIVIIDIDEPSIEDVGEWPWRRTIHAELVEKLLSWGVKGIGFDVFFFNPSPVAGDDDNLVAALAGAKGRVFGASSFSEEIKYVEGNVGDLGQVPEEDQAAYQIPMPKLGMGAGFVNYAFDTDQYVRRSPAVVRRDQPAFALKGLELLDPAKAKAAREAFGRGPFLIRFAGPPQSYTTVSYSLVLRDVLDPRVDYRFNEKISPDIKSYAELFKDKLVLIGTSAIGLKDVFPTPFGDREKQMPGVEIHANVLDTMLNGDPLVPVPGWVDLAALLSLVLALAALMSLTGLWGGIGLMVLFSGVFTAINLYLFQQQIYLELFPPVAGVWITGSVVFAYRFLWEERERRKVRNTLDRYVSPKIVSEVLKDAQPSLKSERRLVTILFSDIAGFTTMSEQLPGDEVERILNEYLTSMTQIVWDNDGALDKYVGDAVMAVWGNVGQVSKSEEDALKAVKTAIEMQEALAELRKKWLTEGMVPLQVRIGINTGEALCGNFGSPLKMDFTVIGDAVNTAARLEGINKEFGTNIIISQPTYELVKDYVNTRYLGPAPVKGKAEKVLIYELIGWRTEAGGVVGVKTQAARDHRTLLGRRGTLFGGIGGERTRLDWRKTQAGGRDDQPREERES